MRMKRWLGALLVLASCGVALPSQAQSMIRRPGQHPKYTFELEPHGLISPFSPPGDTRGWGWGVGARGTLVLEDSGFISTINDSVGIGFGLDYMRYYESSLGAGRCADWAPGPGGQRICRRVQGVGGDASYFYLPVVMQWNFWLHQKWSVFAEPGLGLYLQHRDSDGSVNVGILPVLHGGGRWHVSDRVTVTVRVGYPAWSVGASFFL